MFTRLERSNHLRGVGIVPRGDHHGVNARAVPDRVQVSRGLGKARLAAVVHAAHAGAAGQGVELNICLLKCGNEDTRGVVARANEANDGIRPVIASGVAAWRSIRDVDCRVALWAPRNDDCSVARTTPRILNHDPQRTRIIQQLIRLRGIINCKPVGNQRLHIQSARSHHVQHSLEVTLLGPAHKTDGVIVALLFISRVIAAGAVRRGNLKTDFLFIKIIAAQV